MRSRRGRRALATTAAVLLVGGVGYVEARFRTAALRPHLAATPQVWAHRGYAARHPENSLGAFRAAQTAGATGIELDVWYVPERDRFVVSHDRPFAQPEDRVLLLETVLATFGDALFYWVDLKNLSARNVEAAGVRLARLLATESLRRRVYVESPRGLPLRRLAQRGVQTIYWVEIAPRWRRPVLRSLALLPIKAVIGHSDFAAISAPVWLADDRFLRAFAHLPLFLFTVNDRALLARVLARANVRVVLSDEPWYDAAPRAGTRDR